MSAGVEDAGGEPDGERGPDDGDAPLPEVADGDAPAQPLIAIASTTPAIAVASRSVVLPLPTTRPAYPAVVRVTRGPSN